MTTIVSDTSARERIARIIDPDAWHETLRTDGCGEYWMGRRAKALAKADAILALLPARSEPVVDGAAEVRRLALEEAAADTVLLNMLRDECWDLRCFDVPTGGDDYDVAWRVVGHWQAEPRERTIAEAYSDDPRPALRLALITSTAKKDATTPDHVGRVETGKGEGE